MTDAHDLLPVELLLAIFPLATPRPDLPSSCNLAAKAFAGGEHCHLAWLNLVVSQEPQADRITIAAIRLGGHDVLISRLSRFLIHRLPPAIKKDQGPTSSRHDHSQALPATALAPSNPPPDPIFSARLIERLFAPGGLFIRQAAANIFDDTLRLAIKETSQALAQARRGRLPGFATHVVCAHSSFQLVPDAFSLLIYSLRCSQLEFFTAALAHLASNLPAIFDRVCFPLSQWSCLSLDNRGVLATADRPDIYFITYLAVLAILDWSVLALDIITHQFPTFDCAEFVAWLVTPINSDAIAIFQRSLEGCDNPERALATLDWLRAHYGSPLPMTGRSAIMLPMSHHAADFSVFLAILTTHELPSLAACTDPLSQTMARAKLKDTVRTWLDRGRTKELLPIALQHSLFCWRTCGQYLARALAAGDAETVAMLVQDGIARDCLSYHVMGAVIFLWLQYRSDYPRLVASCEAYLKGQQLDATAALLECSGISYDHLLDLLFGSTWQQSWDFSLILQAWTKGQLKYRDMHMYSREYDHLVARILDKSLSAANPLDLSTISLVKLLDAFVIRLHQLATSDDFELTPASRTAVARIVDQIQSRISVQPFHFEAALQPQSRLDDLRTSIVRASIDRPRDHRSIPTDPMTDGRQFIVHYVALLDRDFVRSSVKWTLRVQPWVWSLFTPQELDARLGREEVCRCLHLPVLANDVEAVVWILDRMPARIRACPKFARSVRSLVRQWPWFGDALDQSTWTSWRESFLPS